MSCGSLSWQSVVCSSSELWRCCRVVLGKSEEQLQECCVAFCPTVVSLSLPAIRDSIPAMCLRLFVQKDKRETKKFVPPSCQLLLSGAPTSVRFCFVFLKVNGVVSQSGLDRYPKNIRLSQH